MPMENEFRDVVSRLNGLCATVEREFGEVKNELRHAEKQTTNILAMFIAVVVLACVALLLAGYAVSTANSNRSLIVELVRQSNQQAVQIEQTTKQVDELQDEAPTTAPSKKP